MSKDKIWIRSSLLELVLPLDASINISVCSLKSLEQILSEFSSSNISLDHWTTLASSSQVETSLTVIRLVYQLTSEFFNRTHSISSSVLVFVLFLQNLNSRRKSRLGLGESKKQSDEKVLQDFIQDSFDIIKLIFDKAERLNKVLELIFCNYVPSMSHEKMLPDLSLDLHSIESCMKQGKHLTWKLSNEDKRGRVKMATTAHLASASGRKRIVLSGASNQIIAKSSDTVTNSSVYIHRCSKSKLYFPTYLRNLELVKSKHCWLVCGGVKRTLKISGCRNSVIVAAAKRVMIQDSRNCTLFLFTPLQPLIASSCHNITLAPFNLSYDNLDRDLESAGLEQENMVNQWNNPELIKNSDHLAPDVTKECHNILPANQFQRCLYPFSNHREEMTVNIPREYLKSLEEKLEKVSELEELLESAKYNNDKKQILAQLVETDFTNAIDDTASDLADYVVAEKQSEFTMII